MDVSKYRKHPKPSIYNSNSKTEAEISLEFESWLISLPNTQKQSLISRLRNSLTKQPTLLARDNLEKQAYKQLTKNAGAAVTELDTDLGEFVAFKINEIKQSSDLPEVSQLLSDASRGFGETVFRREEENYNLIYAAYMNNIASSNTGSDDIRKQIESWVNVISEYMT